jgi:hypothetical protein
VPSMVARSKPARRLAKVVCSVEDMSVSTLETSWLPWRKSGR